MVSVYVFFVFVFFLFLFLAACLQELKMSPYLCLDSTYIVALLMEGFGFTEDRKLTLQKKIDGVEVSWALGATLNLFEKMT